MNTAHLQSLQACQDSLLSLEKMVPIEPLQQKLIELDAQLIAPGLWNDPRRAGALMKERKRVADQLDYMTQAKEYLQFYQELLNTMEGLSDKEVAHLEEMRSHLNVLVFQEMMKDPVDQTSAIISISAGAGGLESANFVTMLYRMYARYADSQGFKIELLDEKKSDEHSSICTDSVSIRVEGSYAFGFFKSESGVHRLVRSSPFNAAGARQTSFAAVYVTPDIEDTIDIKIEDKDLEITTMRGSGPGGQAINKIESAVRMKHIPTGIVVNSRSERSQHDNRRFAIKMMKSKLYELERQKQQDEQDKRISTLTDVSFGHQIRTITMTPYSLVVDHRTGYKINDAQSVLDGNIQEFMIAYLQNSNKTV